MGWRLVQQPNGMFARFSDIVDNFTHYDLTEVEAYTVCRDEFDMLEGPSAEKIEAAKRESGRFEDSLRTIAIVHGQDEADEVRSLLSVSTPAGNESQ